MKKISYFFLSIVIVMISAGVISAQDVNNPRGVVQVYDIASDLPINKYNQYYYENDTVIVSFLFWTTMGRGKVMLKIENKLSEPIYINWSKSQYFVEGMALPLTPYVDKLTDQELAMYDKYKASEPTLTDMDYEWKRQLTPQSEKEKDQIISIQSKSTYTKSNYYIMPADGFVLDTATPYKVEKHRSEKNKKAYVYHVAYTKENTPVKFAVSLVYSAGDKGVDNTMKQNFYVSATYEMDALHFRGKRVGRTPEGFSVYQFPEQRSTRCYIEIDRRNSVSFNTRVR